MEEYNWIKFSSRLKIKSTVEGDKKKRRGERIFFSPLIKFQAAIVIFNVAPRYCEIGFYKNWTEQFRLSLTCFRNFLLFLFFFFLRYMHIDTFRGNKRANGLCKRGEGEKSESLARHSLRLIRSNRGNEVEANIWIPWLGIARKDEERRKKKEKGKKRIKVAINSVSIEESKFT